jgi:hypothetical protein
MVGVRGGRVIVTERHRLPWSVCDIRLLRGRGSCWMIATRVINLQHKSACNVDTLDHAR